MTDKMTEQSNADRGSPAQDAQKRGELVEVAALPLFMVLLIVFFMTRSDDQDTLRGETETHQPAWNESVTGWSPLRISVIPLVSGYSSTLGRRDRGPDNVACAAAMVNTTCRRGGHHRGDRRGPLAARSRVPGRRAEVQRVHRDVGTTHPRRPAQLCTNGTSILRERAGSGTGLAPGSRSRAFLVLIAVAVVIWYALLHTRAAASWRPSALMRSAARLVGISVDRLVAASFLGSALVASIARRATHLTPGRR